MTPAQHRKLVTAYQRGATLRELAAEHGVHESTIRTWLGADVDRRRPGPKDAPVTTERIKQLRDDGNNWAQIGREVGMSRSGARTRYERDVLGRPQPGRG